MISNICLRHSNIFSRLVSKATKFYLKMSEEALANRVKENHVKIEKELASLQVLYEEILKMAVEKEVSKLESENAQLSKQVGKLINELKRLECLKGIPQIPVPGQPDYNEEQLNVPEKPVVVNEPTEEVKPVENKPKDKKKDKPAAPPKTPKAPKESAPEPDVDVGRLDFRVGKIVEVNKHPDADSLYVEKVECGEANPRTVVSGLVKYVPIEEMQNRMVVILCNLKPAKMRGVLSEAMVMCASTPERVEVLSPPEGSVPGDLVHCEGFPRQPDAQLNPKKKIFETVATDLLTNDSLIACYKGKALHVPGKGNVVAQTLKNVNVK